jgi:hypothetical protein
MLTPQQMHFLHEDLFERLLVAGWLKQYTFTKGKGWHLSWTERGAHIAVRLKQLRAALDLGAADERPVIASILFHGFCPDPRSNAETIKAALRPLVTEGVLAGFVFVHGKKSEVTWTPKGHELSAWFCARLAELKVEMADEDRLITLFIAVDGWAPDEHTKIVVE